MLVGFEFEGNKLYCELELICIEDQSYDCDCHYIPKGANIKSIMTEEELVCIVKKEIASGYGIHNILKVYGIAKRDRMDLIANLAKTSFKPLT